MDHKLELQIWLWSENQVEEIKSEYHRFTAAGHIYPVTRPDQCIYMKLLDSMITADLSSTLYGNHAFVLVLKLYIYGNDLILLSNHSRVLADRYVTRSKTQFIACTTDYR